MKVQVKRLYVIIFFVFFSMNIFSQDVDFIEYKAEKGETLFQIARQYNTTIHIIYELNPQYKTTILKIGDVVKVPKSSTNVNSSLQTDGLNTIKIVAGDTKFAVSKKYNVSIQTLEELNPQIRQMLQVGQIVKIPNSSRSISESESKLNSNNLSFNNSDPNDYLVKSGETLWGIAKANGISVNSLIQANKDRLDGVLKTGQYLRIPNGTTNAQISSNNLNESSTIQEGGLVYHIVQGGETKFGLSKKYQTSIEELERKNPHIKPMLMIGQKLLISGQDTYSNNSLPNKSISNADEGSSNNQNNVVGDSNSEEEIEFVDYEIQPQETLFSLSKKASMSQQDFMKLNPVLQSGVNIGTIIKMPKNSIDLSKSVELPNKIEDKNNKLDFDTDLIEYPNDIQYSEIVSKIDISKKLNLTFIFSEDIEKLDEFELQSDESKIAFEQYKGIVLAIDTFKRLGVNINPVFLNTKSNNFKGSEWKKQFENSDVIIGGHDAFRFDEVLDFAKEHKKHVIVPTKQDLIVEDSRVIYAYPNELHQKIFMINYMKSLNANIIVVADATDSESSNFIRSYEPSIKFAPLDSRGVINNDRFRLLFDKNKINFVVLDTDKNNLIISSTNFLLSESNNFGIKLALFKSRDLINSPDISDIRLKVLQMIYPAILNPNENSITKFKELYINKYDKSPTKESKISFDVTLDLISRLLYHKSTSEITNLNTKQEHMKFHYETFKSSYWNSGIFIIKYQ